MEKKEYSDNFNIKLNHSLFKHLYHIQFYFLFANCKGIKKLIKKMEWIEDMEMITAFTLKNNYPHAETIKLDFKFCDPDINIISSLLSMF